MGLRCPSCQEPMHHKAIMVGGKKLALPSVPVCSACGGAYIIHGPDGEEFVRVEKPSESVRAVDLAASVVAAYGLLAERCETCVFAAVVRTGDYRGYLRCRRYPPARTRDLFWAQYPFVHKDGWCGECDKGGISVPANPSEKGSKDGGQETEED